MLEIVKPAVFSLFKVLESCMLISYVIYKKLVHSGSGIVEYNLYDNFYKLSKINSKKYKSADIRRILRIIE